MRTDNNNDNCPQCDAPCKLSHDWNNTYYYYDPTELEKLKDENKRLRIRLEKQVNKNIKLKARMRKKFFESLDFIG